MNKSVLKHEIKNIRGVFFLSLLLSIALAGVFSLSLKSEFNTMVVNGIYPNSAPILRNINIFTAIAMLGFLLISILQVYVQFRGEKGQELARFLKALPIKTEEYFTTKLLVGFLSLSLAFLVLILGVLIIRQSNMFWIEDYHRLSVDPGLFISLDSGFETIKILGLAYIVSLVFYTFLFFIQYRVSNVLVGIIVGSLIWLSPWFIAMSLEVLTETISPLTNLAQWISPFLYPLDYDYFRIFPEAIRAYGYGRVNEQIHLGYISHIEAKYMLGSFFIILNTCLAYKSLGTNLIEDEDKMIARPGDRIIFILGVGICSGLLVSDIVSIVLGLSFQPGFHWFLTGLGSILGLVVSWKISRIGLK